MMKAFEEVEDPEARRRSIGIKDLASALQAGLD
jgi:hypothetical protein